MQSCHTTAVAAFEALAKASVGEPPFGLLAAQFGTDRGYTLLSLAWVAGCPSAAFIAVLGDLDRGRTGQITVEAFTLFLRKVGTAYRS